MTTPTQTFVQQTIDTIPEWAKDPLSLPLKFQPTSDRIVVFPDPMKTTTAGGLQISTVTRGKIEPVGTVIKVGPGKWSEYSGTRVPMEIKEGSKIIFGMFTGDDYLLDREGRLTPFASVGRVTTDHLLVKVLRQDAVLAVLS